MKLLQLIASVDPRHGGPVESLKRVSEALAALGHSTEVLTLDMPDAPYLKDFPLPVHALGPSYSTYQYSPQALAWLEEHVQRFDAMLVRGLWRYTTQLAQRSSRKSGVPYFVFPHGMLDPWFKKAYPLKHLKKYAFWLAFEYRALRDARAIFFTSEEEKRLASQTFFPYQCIEQVVQYGTATPPDSLDECKREFFNAFPGLEEKRVILFLGRVHPKKGCDLLIEAFSHVSQSDRALHLVIAGPYEEQERQKLDTIAQASNVHSRITWTKSLKGRIKWGALSSAEVFCLPSHQENFGIAVVEALACKTPVLISDKVNIWKEIDSAKAGLVEPDSLAGTISLLSRWLELDENERQQMAARASELFATSFEIGAAARSLSSNIKSRL